MKSRQAGYTVVEMITVVAIVGILSLVTVPAFMNYYTTSKVKTSVRNFSTDLRRVRQLAISNGVQSKLSFATGPSGTRSYNFYLGDSAVGTPAWTARTKPVNGTPGADGYTRNLEDIVYFPANSGTTPQTFTDVDSDGTLDVIFLPNGSVQIPTGLPAGSSATISLKTDNAKVSQAIYKIDVSPSGRVVIR